MCLPCLNRWIQILGNIHEASELDLQVQSSTLEDKENNLAQWICFQFLLI